MAENQSLLMWPWAQTICDGYPLTHDESRHLQLTPEKQTFLSEQIRHEQSLERMSQAFGNDLLPGMYCMPHYVVPKPHSDNWRLVNDLSAGDFSPNSMIDHSCVTGYPMDTLSHLGDLLLRKLKENPEMELLIWKSDISEAYRICPMHELWQLKQIVRLQEGLCVDRVNMFGGSSSGPIFISFNALTSWIARFERLIESLAYVDDSFGVNDCQDMTRYEPYDRDFPTQQARLLQLWDEIGIPHKEKKQIFGVQLSVLGIEVDAKELTFTLPLESKLRLSKELSEWSRKGVRRKVKEWQQLTGWINWVLNVFPLLRPSLNNIYAKLKGKDLGARVWSNAAIREDLEWAQMKVDESDGVHLLKSVTWELSEATCLVKTDACPEGIAFWYPNSNLGFSAPTPRHTPATQIIFYEALAVLSALDDASRRFPSRSKVVIFTDNSVTVSMFNSLKSLPEYNCILKSAVDILINCDLQLRVLHIAGERNDVADALSRADFMRALHLHPHLTIRTFNPYIQIDHHQAPPRLQPPRHLPLGAVRC